MKVEIGFSEFHDRIQVFDSCSLSYAATRALWDWVGAMNGEGLLLGVGVGDLAILSCEYTVAELNGEHDRELESVDDVREAVSWDFLDNCYSDVIEVDSDTVVLIGL